MPRMNGAQLLRTWRRAREMTQETLAQKVRCSQTLVAQWESGARLPGGDKRQRIAKVTSGAVPVTIWEAKGV